MTWSYVPQLHRWLAMWYMQNPGDSGRQGTYMASSLPIGARGGHCVQFLNSMLWGGSVTMGFIHRQIQTRENEFGKHNLQRSIAREQRMIDVHLAIPPKEICQIFVVFNVAVRVGQAPRRGVAVKVDREPRQAAQEFCVYLVKVVLQGSALAVSQRKRVLRLSFLLEKSPFGSLERKDVPRHVSERYLLEQDSGPQEVLAPLSVI